MTSILINVRLPDGSIMFLPVVPVGTTGMSEFADADAAKDYIAFKLRDDVKLICDEPAPKPTWKNTLNGEELTIFTYTMDTFSDEAKKLGYPFFSWNGRVYKTDAYYTHHEIHDICLASELT